MGGSTRRKTRLPKVDPATHKLFREKPGNPPSWNKPYPCGVPCADIKLGGLDHETGWTMDLSLAKAVARVATSAETTTIRASAQANVFSMNSLCERWSSSAFRRSSCRPRRVESTTTESSGSARESRNEDIKTDDALVRRINAILPDLPPFETLPDPSQENKPIVIWHKGAKFPDLMTGTPRSFTPSSRRLQSVDNTIRIFPAWPAGKDAEFAGLRWQGGFLGSGSPDRRYDSRCDDRIHRGRDGGVWCRRGAEERFRSLSRKHSAVVVMAGDVFVSFPTEAGTVYSITRK